MRMLSDLGTASGTCCHKRRLARSELCRLLARVRGRPCAGRDTRPGAAVTGDVLAHAVHQRREALAAKNAHRLEPRAVLQLLR